MLEKLIDNWYLIVACLALGGCAGFAAHEFVGLPKDLKLKLLYHGIKRIVIQAESYFGTKQGTAKLKWAWEALVFLPFVGKSAHTLITEQEFKSLVDIALRATGIWADEQAK